jgi:hypothetical protein
MNTSVEKEILKATKAKPPQENETRQTYLQRLAVMIAEIPEVNFDSMSPTAQNWGNTAIEAINASKELPEFGDPVTQEEVKTKEAVAVAKVMKEATKTKRSVGNVKDKYGYRVGSKTSEVIVMFESGAKMTDIKQRFGSPHYNVLKQLQQAGHKVERVGGNFKLTHKDETS